MSWLTDHIVATTLGDMDVPEQVDQEHFEERLEARRQWHKKNRQEGKPMAVKTGETK